MKLVRIPKFKIYKGSPILYIQEKMNGHFMYVDVSPGGVISCTTKKVGVDVWAKIQRNLPAIAEKIKRIPPASLVLGELHHPEVYPTEVKTMLNGNHDKEPMFSVFAAPYLDGIATMHWYWSAITERLVQYGLDIVPTRSFVPNAKRLTTADLESLCGEARRRKLEGFVLKEQTFDGWYKLKVTRTVDAVVMAKVMSGHGMNWGKLKNLQVGVYKDGKLVPIADVGGGYNETQRVEFMRQDMVGRVVEVAFDSLTADNQLFFPRFLRLRDDKQHYECTWDNLLAS